MTMTRASSVSSVACYADRLQHAASRRSTNDSAAGASACNMEAPTKSPSATSSSCSSHSRARSSHGRDLTVSVQTSATYTDLSADQAVYSGYNLPVGRTAVSSLSTQDQRPPDAPLPAQPSLCEETLTPDPVFSIGAFVSRAPSNGAAALAQMKRAMLDDPVFRSKYWEASALDIEC